MFGKRKQTKEGEIGLPEPKGLPTGVASYMVVKMEKDPMWVLDLKVVLRPAGKKNAFYCRVFDATQTAGAKVNVKDWTSLDEHPDLIVLECYFDKDTNIVRPEKFIKPSSSSE